MKTIINQKRFGIQLVKCALIASLFTSCTVDSNISNDPRFAPLLGENLATKSRLKLYEPNRWDDLYELTTTDSGDKGLLGAVPIGTNVSFERAMRFSGGGGVWERLEGHISYKGRSYPIGYNLGLTFYPDGWRVRLNDDFNLGREADKSE